MNAAEQSTLVISFVRSHTLLVLATAALLLYTIGAVAFAIWKRKRQ